MAADKLRIDKWLWHARFFKTRTLSAAQVSGGHVRVNGTKVSKPAHAVTPGDVLTFVQSREVRVVRIEALGARRGPASEAQTLYSDLTPKRETPVPKAPGFDGKGRPTGRDRRKFDLSKSQHLE